MRGKTMPMSVVELPFQVSIAVPDMFTVTKMIGALLRFDARYVFVTDDKKKVLGMVSFPLLFRSHLDTQDTAVKQYVEHCTAIDVKSIDTQKKNAELLLRSDADVIPLLEQDSFAGEFSIYEVLRNIQEGSHSHNVLIKDLKKPVSNLISDSASLGDLIHVFHTVKEKEVIIADQSKHFRGIIRDTDLLEEYYLHQNVRVYGQESRNKSRYFHVEKDSILEMPAKSFIRPDVEPIWVTDDDTVLQAAKKMYDHRSTYAYVRDTDNKMVAMIVARDLLKVITRAEEQVMPQVMIMQTHDTLLTNEQKINITEIAEKYVEKMKHFIRNFEQLKIHIKTYSREGHAHKYSVHSKCYHDGTIAATKGSHDWNLITAVRKDLDDVEQVLKINAVDTYGK